MEESKQRNHQRNRRRERAARMQKQKAESRDQQGSGEDESPVRNQKQRPPTRKKRIKVGKDQPLFEEDVIDGFAILSFRTYEELEKSTMKSLDKRPSRPLQFVLDAKIEKISTPYTNHKQRHKQVPNLLNNNNNNSNDDEEEEEEDQGGGGGRGATSDSEICNNKAVIQEVNGPALLHHNNNNNSNAARYRLSDVSSHSSSGRGYMCDSESNDDRGSDTDLFRASSIKLESNNNPTNGRSSPLLLAPIIQNGPTNNEPPVVPTTTTTTTVTTTTSVLTTKSPSPPLFSPPPPLPFLATEAKPPLPSSLTPPPVVHHNHRPHTHHHQHHHGGHPLLQQQQPSVGQVPVVSSNQQPQHRSSQPPHFIGGSSSTSSSSNGPTLFSPISPQRPQLRTSPPLLLSTSPSVPPKASSVCSTTSVITQARPSPGVGASPATTPSRDSHSSSSSSISSLSQLSQSLHLPPRDASRNNTPSCCGVSTSLVFSKPSWASPGAINGPHLTPPPGRPTPPHSSAGPLGIPLHNHTGHFSGVPSSAAPPPPGPSLGPHPGIFPPPIALSSPSLSLANPGPAAPFTDPIFSQPNQQDLLRRELDTRFLASQDRSISIPPPPYMRAEMHMHQHSPFLGLGNTMVPQPNPHMYDKFPKLEPHSFYSRNTLGLPSYPGLTPLLGAAGTAPGPAPPTPFSPAGQLAAFQPKKHPNLMARSRLDAVLPENMSNLVKSKNLKSGRWCAMHVRIAWEIYHHQQKQQQQHQQAEAHKPPSMGKNPSDLLRPPGHLFSSAAGMPRPHDLPPLSGSLLAATASRQSFEAAAAQHHNSFLNPSPAHLGVTHFARPSYPGFGGSFAAGLSTLGLAGPGLFANRELSAAAAATCLSGLSGAQDPLYRLHRTATFGPPPPVVPPASAGGGASWGGLKAEADRERMHREQQEQEHKRREKEHKEHLDRERREQERQKERDRENRVFHHHHHHHIAESLRNGDPTGGVQDHQTQQQQRSHHHHHHQPPAPHQHPSRDWGSERRNERTREASRSPMRKSDSAFESGKVPTRPPETIKVKEEKKEDDCVPTVVATNNSVNHMTERTAAVSAAVPAANDFLARTLVGHHHAHHAHHRGVLNSLPAERLPPPPPHHSFWGGLPPGDHFRNLEFHQAAREQMMHRYGPLVPVGAHERFREAAEFARHDSFAAAFDRSKLAPPPLRPNDPYPGTGLGAPPPGSIFPPLLPGLGSARSKGNSPSTAIPPPLIPCTGALQNHQGASHKLGLPENPHEPYFARERQELGLHPSELDAQSR